MDSATSDAGTSACVAAASDARAPLANDARTPLSASADNGPKIVAVGGFGVGKPVEYLQSLYAATSAPGALGEPLLTSPELAL
ncbi:hypothetical protein ACIPC1_27695 [Streptomyces sp. NPDC087263]|uniref:hypothetical protein n=1 Tax=Streptomyces sp. NPDC087263 TaxID=3365773 RepID=UPI00382ACCD5